MAISLMDLSNAQRAAGDLDRARATSRRALQVAKSCKAGSLIRARWPDGVPAAPAPGGPATLSDAERRVAELAAQGHANREVGRQLHITVSTVEQHLTRVYRKLNVRSRSDLAAALRLLTTT
jgi:DNA-binding CsgD family transcriptional regulator